MSLINEVLQDLDQRDRASGSHRPLQLTSTSYSQQGGDVAVGQDQSPRHAGRRLPLWVLVTAMTLVGILIGFSLDALNNSARSPGHGAAVALASDEPALGAATESEAPPQVVGDQHEAVSGRPLVVTSSLRSASGVVPVVPVPVLEETSGGDLPGTHQKLVPAAQTPDHAQRQPELGAAKGNAAAVASTPTKSSDLVGSASGTETPATAVAESADAAIAEPEFIALRNAVEPPGATKPSTARRAARPRPGFTPAKSNAALPLAQAEQAIDRGELAVAEQLLQRRLGEAPGDRRARELLIGLMLRGERYPAAIEQLDKGLARAPSHAKFMLIKARLLAQAGDMTGALGLLESLPRAHDGRVEAVQMLGALYQQQGRYADAVVSYRELLGLKPNYGPAWVGYAISLDGTGDPKALAAYRRALRLGGVPSAAAMYARERIAQLEVSGD